jgi:hypothetical protein
MNSRNRSSIYKTVTQVGAVPVDEQENHEKTILLQTSSHQSTDVKENFESPEIFGPKMWFTLHNGASHYPVEASDIYAEKMRNFIIALPIMIPCENCKIHAIKFIELRKDKLFEICKKRDTLFDFFVDFHNNVNERQGKKILSYKEARQIYQMK